MSMDEITRVIGEMQNDITTLKVRQDNDHDRINEHRSLNDSVQRLNVNFENLTEQLRGQNQRIDRLHTTIQEQLNLQGVRHGERLGDLEKFKEAHMLIAVKLSDRLRDVEAYVDEQKSKGSKLLGGMAEKVVYTLIGAAIMFLFYQIGLG